MKTQVWLKASTALALILSLGGYSSGGGTGGTGGGTTTPPSTTSTVISDLGNTVTDVGDGLTGTLK